MRVIVLMNGDERCRMLSDEPELQIRWQRLKHRKKQSVRTTEPQAKQAGCGCHAENGSYWVQVGRQNLVAEMRLPACALLAASLSIGVYTCIRTFGKLGSLVAQIAGYASCRAAAHDLPSPPRDCC